jgi:hypothetical protein
MARHHSDWVQAFMDYASFGEAPRHLYFWTAVSAIAGALRRHVWIDQGHFKWYPNMYIILVAPPGIISKSTTASIGMKLLRRVPGIKFGPDVVTWPALIQGLSEATEMFEMDGAYTTMSAMTLEASEFGNLFNPQDKEMVDMFVSLWDSKDGSFDKKTKHSGSDEVVNPCLNLIACTTPSWIAGNFPEYMVGGGFTSRCVFAYADAKARFNAYPKRSIPTDFESMRDKLVADLEHISQRLLGEYILTEEAMAWGEEWYKKLYSERPPHLDDERFGGYIARKQSHAHKLAMILTAATTDELIIQKDILAASVAMVEDLEADMAFVFSKIGKSDTSFFADRLIGYVHKVGALEYMDLFRYMHAHFPSLSDYEDILAGCMKAGYVKSEQRGDKIFMIPGIALVAATNGRQRD